MGEQQYFNWEHSNFDMKLFAVACLTGASAQSGDYDDRGAVGESDYYNAYDNYDEFGNKKKNKGDNWFASGAKQYAGVATTSTSWASALNCWPANIEADTLVAPNHRNTAVAAAPFENGSARNPTTYPNQYDFNLAPQHVYGSFEVSNRAIERTVLTAAGESTLHQEDPIQRSGLGGLYQYGHDTFNSLEHNQKLDGSSTIGTHWDHYKQARHAGCLYEKSDWSYSHTTFDKVYVANYYQGYGDFTSGTAASPAFVTATDAGEVEPIWWHFFNAHVLPNNDGGAQYPRSQTDPFDAGYLDPAAQKSIPLVMANPAYEGLGYLNFVVEYKTSTMASARTTESSLTHLLVVPRSLPQLTKPRTLTAKSMIVVSPTVKSVPVTVTLSTRGTVLTAITTMTSTWVHGQLWALLRLVIIASVPGRFSPSTARLLQQLFKICLPTPLLPSQPSLISRWICMVILRTLTGPTPPIWSFRPFPTTTWARTSDSISVS